MMGKLILVRHGATAFNKQGGASVDDQERLRGWKDVPLDERGQQQAAGLGQQFQGLRADRLTTSPLVRAAETADEIGKALGMAAVRDNRLKPWNLGGLAGKKMSEVLPVMIMLQKTNTKAPGGESFQQFLERFLPALEEAVTAAEAGHDIVMVCHTRNCQAARAWIAAGCKGTKIDEKVMDDYGGEVPAGGVMVVTPEKKT